jgi:hypothetical protein
VAIWHFDIHLLPECGLMRIHGHIPDELPTYGAMTLDTSLDEIPLHNYWEGFDIFRDLQDGPSVSRTVRP